MGFGHRMRLMRVHRGISQAELQRRTGIDQSIISRIEAEQVIPNVELEQRIREALGWDEDGDRAFEILTGESKKKPA